jgi:hypothetical protein
MRLLNKAEGASNPLSKFKMNKILAQDRRGMAPVMMIWYVMAGLVGFIGWTFVLGNFLFAFGFTAASFFLVKWARKKWLPGILAILVVVITLVTVYALFLGVWTI